MADDPVLDIVRRRWSVLEPLLDGPTYKRDLVAAVDRSRSTVDRAVRELADAGLVERTDGGYVASVAGRLAADRYREATESLATVEDAAAALAPLPHDASLPAALLTDATVTVAEAADGSLVDRFVDRAASADGVRVALGTMAASGPDGADLAERCRGAATEPVLVPGAEHDPEKGGRGRPVEGEPPPFSLCRTTGPDAVVALVHGEDGSPHALLETTAPAALSWAADRLDALDPRQAGGTAPDSDRPPRSARLASEGFEQVGGAAERSPPDQVTCLRGGAGFAAVAAGHTLPRERAVDGGRERLDDALLERLDGGDCVALVGPAGSGKSTVCRQVAWRWHESGRGVVRYRPSDRGRPFESTGELAARLRADDGHSLVVVEDAVRSAGAAVFETVAAFRDDPTVSVLVDARREEWADPPGDPLAPELAAVRHEAVSLVSMPPLDDRERERFVRHVADRLGHDPDDLADAVRAASSADGTTDESTGTEDGAPDEATDGMADDGPEPSELLAFLHRLAALAGPGDDVPSALRADAASALNRFREAGGATYDAAVLVNLLNAAGIEVEPAYLYALVAPPTDHDPAAVDAAVDALHGRVLFGASPLSGRPVHTEWSVSFLGRLVATEPAPAARRRVGRTLSAFLSLAADEPTRAAVRDALGAEPPVLAAVAADPTGWADDAVERLFTLATRQPGLAPLYGESGRSAIDCGVCSAETVARCAGWRAQAYFDQGDYGTTERETAVLCRRAGGVSAPLRDRLRSEACYYRAWTAIRSGEYGAGDAHAAWALAFAERVPDGSSAARALSVRGVAAWHAGDLDAAETHLRAAEERVDPERDPTVAAVVANNSGILAYERGRFDDALERFERSRTLRERVGDRIGLVDSLINVGVIERDRGQGESAVGRFERAVELARLAGARNHLAHALRALGNTLATLGRTDEAVAPLEEALGLVSDIGNDEGLAHCCRGLGVVARERGEYGTAADRLARSREAADRADNDRALALALRELGVLSREQGDHGESLDRLDDALAAFGDTTNAETARAHRERAETLLALGERAAAREALATAREQYRSLGAEALAADCAARLDAVAD